MGVLNITPDSFSDGGRFLCADAALRQAEAMVEAGADLIDIGGESTRPGAEPVSDREEIRRVMPVIGAITRRFSVLLSVDTSKPAVMRAAADAGVGLINDVRALRAPGALDAARDTGLAVCLMHMQGEPRHMQDDPRYGDVIDDVRIFLQERVAACRNAGIGSDRLLVDPGFGFGKTLQHNLAILARLTELADLGVPLLAGLSRKSMLGAITGRPASQRTVASVAAAMIAVQRGAAIVRVHDVAETVDALAVWRAIETAERRPRTAVEVGGENL